MFLLIGEDIPLILGVSTSEFKVNECDLNELVCFDNFYVADYFNPVICILIGPKVSYSYTLIFSTLGEGVTNVEVFCFFSVLG